MNAAFGAKEQPDAPRQGSEPVGDQLWRECLSEKEPRGREEDRAMALPVLVLLSFLFFWMFCVAFALLANRQRRARERYYKFPRVTELPRRQRRAGPSVGAAVYEMSQDQRSLELLTAAVLPPKAPLSTSRG